jgi:beta-fructofuranosidase
MPLYRPGDAWLADVIPFYWDGLFHLYYLMDRRRVGRNDCVRPGEGIPWHHVVTRDFVTFEELGEAIPAGGPDDQDYHIYTGCVVRADDEFLAFFTGYNPRFRGTGRPAQAIMVATSKDLTRWSKLPNPVLLADPARFEPDDWRDPVVYYDSGSQRYRMILTARLLGKEPAESGCIPCFESTDLRSWTFREMVWSPDEYYSMECPDLFREDGRWYLIYSEFSKGWATRYCCGPTSHGPWESPEDSQLDSAAYYAARTVSDGRERYLLGWVATRSDDSDAGEFDWGGNLLVHRVGVQRDGQLGISAPLPVLGQFTSRRQLNLNVVAGPWVSDAASITTSRAVRRASCLVGRLQSPSMFQTTIRYRPADNAFGFLIYVDESMTVGYELRFEPGSGLMALKSLTAHRREPALAEKHLAFESALLRVRCLVEDGVFTAYVNDEVAMTARLYEWTAGELGLFQADAQASFHELELWQNG